MEPPVATPGPHATAGDLDRWIREHWNSTICVQRDDEPGDRDDALLGLPYPYTVPSPGKVLHEMYYWDTYFTNLGLIRHGRMQQVEYNILNLFHMIERFGKVLNGNLRRYLTRSQPPLLTAMVADYLAAGGDRGLVATRIDLLLAEHDAYWDLPPHLTACGLNRYYDSSETPVVEHYADGHEATLTPGQLAVCESGWDMTPRMAGGGRRIIPVDLNAILYRNERQLARLLFQMDRRADAERLRDRARERRRLVLQLLRGKDGCFYDFDLETGALTGVASAAPAALLWAQMLPPERAEGLRVRLLELEAEWGLATCLHDYGCPGMQWNWPMGWAPLHGWLVRGLLDYGYRGDAERIARKFMALVLHNWRQTGQLWEKYNVVTGGLDVVHDRYPSTTHLGWTAGVFVELHALFPDAPPPEPAPAAPPAQKARSRPPARPHRREP